MKFNTILNNFSAGAWSEKMIARGETEEYFKACRELTNMIPQLQGGAYRRPGTLEKAFEAGATAILNATSNHRAIPYVLSDGTKNILFVNSNLPGGVGTEWFVYNTVTGLKSNLVVAGITNSVDTDIATAQFVQAGDFLFIVSKGNQPRFVFRNSFGDYLLYPFFYWWFLTGSLTDSWRAFPYKPISADGIDGTLTVTGTFTVGGTVTVTSSYGRFTAADPVNGAATLAGTFIKISSGGSTGVMQLIGFTNPTTVTGQVLSVIPGASPITVGAAAGTSFEMSAWNGREGWPRTVTIFEQRLYFGGNTLNPDTVWASRIGNYGDMMEMPFQQDPDFSTFSADNSRPWSAAIAVSSQSYQIQSMAASKTLEIHTTRSDIVAYGGNGNALGPLNKVFESTTSFGSEPIQPVRVNNYSTFVQRGGRKVRDTVFNFNEDQYKSSDLMFMADHLTYNDPIKRLASSEFLTTSLLLAVTQTGRLLACAIDRDYKVNAWHEWTFESLFGVRVLDVVIIPQGGDYNEDVIYIFVARTLSGGIPSYQLLRVRKIFEGEEYEFYDSSDDQMHYMDFIKLGVNATSPTPNVQVTGLSAFNGETVSVIGDSYYLGDFVVSGGAITLPRAVNLSIVGLKYRSYLKTMPIAAGAQFGTPINQTKSAARMIINLYKTLTCKYKTTGTSEFFNIPLRDPTVPGDEVTPVFTGEKVMTLPQYIGRKFQVEFETSDPFPMNITSIVLEGITND